MWTQMSESEPPDYLQTFSTWPESIKSAESWENLMWEHSRGFPAEKKKKKENKYLPVKKRSHNQCVTSCLCLLHLAARPFAWIKRRICCCSERFFAENFPLHCPSVKIELRIKSGPNSQDFIRRSCLKNSWRERDEVNCLYLDSALSELETLAECSRSPSTPSLSVHPRHHRLGRPQGLYTYIGKEKKIISCYGSTTHIQVNWIKYFGTFPSKYLH